MCCCVSVSYRKIAGVRTVYIDVRKSSSPRCRRMPMADGTMLVGTVLMHMMSYSPNALCTCAGTERVMSKPYPRMPPTSPPNLSTSNVTAICVSNEAMHALNCTARGARRRRTDRGEAGHASRYACFEHHDAGHGPRRALKPTDASLRGPRAVLTCLRRMKINSCCSRHAARR